MSSRNLLGLLGSRVCKNYRVLVTALGTSILLYILPMQQSD